ncbi:hypothetical protein Q7C36_006372 [Tachysurus vachellii]|uniref:Uncharacterized protein n=1 Tax=Tachysurus vachellii TaxID=175792 RepID=A0AA88NA71_TACVA|nr:hypothetical protein Q7C36_006372 [Tachysurus vachellii]
MLRARVHTQQGNYTTLLFQNGCLIYARHSGKGWSCLQTQQNPHKTIRAVHAGNECGLYKQQRCMIWSIFSGGEPGLSVELDEFLGSSPDSLEEVIYIAESWKYMNLEDRDAGPPADCGVFICSCACVLLPLASEEQKWHWLVCFILKTEIICKKITGPKRGWLFGILILLDFSLPWTQETKDRQH